MNKFSSGFALISIVIILGIVAAVYLILNPSLPSTLRQNVPTEMPVTPTGTSPKTTSDWNTFALENISFKYPDGWGPPETFDTNFGLGGRIESAESEHVIGVLTGLNKGRTPEENEKFIEDFSLGGGQKLTLDGSMASLHVLEYEGTKAITVYVLSKNKDSAYSISITSKADDENTENLFNQILSTFKFLDDNNEPTQPIAGKGCVVGGCNGELCQEADEEPLASICIFRPEYECYKSATCERQANGKCGWTQTEELEACLVQYQN